jgi:stage II sporulation protein B
MNKGRITYRFDPKEGAESTRRAARVHEQEENVIPLYQEEYKVIEPKIDRSPKEITPYDQAERDQVESIFEPHALNTFTTDFGSWHSQIESEGERVERIIRETQISREQQNSPIPTTVIRQEREPEPAPADNREEWSSWTSKDPYRDPGTGTRYTKSTGAPWIRIATSVAGAVVTGIAFGFFVLSMFSSDRDTSTSIATSNPTKITVPSPNTQSAASTTKTQTGTGDVALPATTAAVTAVQIPAKSYTFLQNGVFSSLQGAQAVQDSLNKKGLASAMDNSDKLTVFVGFAKTRTMPLP